MEETTDLVNAIESKKGFLIKDNDSRQALKLHGFGDGKKHGLLLRDYEALFLIYTTKLAVLRDEKILTFSTNQDTFLRTGPFLMPNSGNESHGHARSYAFGFK